MSIQEHLNKIRNAVYGREVRESIAKGIETAYNDASEKHDNANMEVKLARGTKPNLNARLDDMEQTDQEVTTQLAQKANKTQVDSLEQRQNDVIQSVDLDPNKDQEIIDARNGESTLGSRIRLNNKQIDRVKQFKIISPKFLEYTLSDDIIYHPSPYVTATSIIPVQLGDRIVFDKPQGVQWKVPTLKSTRVNLDSLIEMPAYADFDDKSIYEVKDSNVKAVAIMVRWKDSTPITTQDRTLFSQSINIYKGNFSRPDLEKNQKAITYGYSKDLNYQELWEVGGMTNGEDVGGFDIRIRTKDFITDSSIKKVVTDTGYVFVVAIYGLDGSFSHGFGWIKEFSDFDFENYKYRFHMRKESNEEITLDEYDKLYFYGKPLQAVKKLEDNLSEVTRDLAYNLNRKDGNLTYYKERFRPYYHFTPEFGFMNDPNGVVYYDGEYHLFYQYHPGGMVTDIQNWGHAVSKDLVRWEHLPIAIEHDFPTRIFSGSCVIDKDNTSGFGANAMVAVYTENVGVSGGRHQSTCLAYSLDKGRTFTKYSGNPVQSYTEAPGGELAAFRDPKVIWHEESGAWVMALTTQGAIRFYSSPDLITWTYLSKFEDSSFNIGECPNLFKMVSDDNQEKWVLQVSPSRSYTLYWVGDFDGVTFTPDGGYQKLDYGFDFYATTFFTNVPSDEVYGISWANHWENVYEVSSRTENFNGVMSLPFKVTLKNINGEYSLEKHSVNLPYNSIPMKYQSENLSGNKEVGAGTSAHIVATFDVTNSTATKFGVDVFKRDNEYTRISYDVSTGTLSVDRSSSGDVSSFGTKLISSFQTDLIDNKLVLNIHIDRSIVEVYAEDGVKSITQTVFPGILSTEITAFSDSEIGVEVTTNLIDSTWGKDGFNTNIKSYQEPSPSNNVFIPTSQGLGCINVSGSNGFYLSNEKNKSQNFTYTCDVELFNDIGLGLVFKADEALENLYCLLLDKANGALKLWGRKNNVVFTLSETPVELQMFTTYNIKVETREKSISIYLDDELIETVTDYDDSIGYFGVIAYNRGGGLIQNLYAY